MHEVRDGRLRQWFEQRLWDVRREETDGRVTLSLCHGLEFCLASSSMLPLLRTFWAKCLALARGSDTRQDDLGLIEGVTVMRMNEEY